MQKSQKKQLKALEDSIVHAAFTSPCEKAEEICLKDEVVLEKAKIESVEQKENGVLCTVSLTELQMQSFYRQMLQQLKKAPALWLKMQQEAIENGIKKEELNSDKIDMLLQMSTEIQLERNYLQAELTNGQLLTGLESEMLSERVAKSFDDEEKLKRELQNTKNEKKLFSNELNQLAKDLYIEAIKIGFFTRSDGCQIDSSVLHEKFHQLVEQEKTSLVAFIPFLSLLFGCIDPQNLEDLLIESKKRSRHLTYAIPVLYTRYFLSSGRSANIESLKVLQKVFPQDIYLKGFIETLELKKEEIIFESNRLSIVLNTAMNALLSHDTNLSIRIIQQNKPYFIGFSYFYQYLALSLILENNLEKAEKQLKIAEQLPGINELNGSYIIRQITNMFKILIKDELPALEFSPSQRTIFLDSFLTLVKALHKDDFQNKVLAFLQVVEETLQSDVENILFVYLALRWLSTHLPIEDNFEKIRDVFNALFHLMSLCVEIGFDENEPWFAEKFTRNKESWVVNFSEIKFSNEKTALSVQFEKIELDIASQRLLMLETTKLAYHMTVSYMCKDVVNQVEIDEFLPQSASLYRSSVIQGFQVAIRKGGHNDRASKNANVLAKTYLELNTHPYEFQPDFIEWIKLSHAFCSTETIVLPQSFKSILKLHKISPDFTINSLSLKDSLQALNNLSHRKQVIEINQHEFVHSYLLDMQQLVGWRLGETFEEWGVRLSALREHPIAINDYNLLPLGLLENNNPLDQGDFIPTSSLERAFIRSILDFWIEFHTFTTNKNNHINAGGSEDISEVQLETSSDKQKHQREVNKLKNVFRGLTRYQSEQDYSALMAATLLSATHLDREEGSHHSIFVANEVIARQIYQILLEVSIQRLIHRFIIEKGHCVSVADASKNLNFIRDLFQSILGDFHGPERHLTGNGPTQVHYNAKTLIQGGSHINTHIFYE